MKKLIAPVMLAAALLLGGCVSTPGIYSGTVSTATYADPPSPALFVVLPPDPLSLTDRNIAALIEAKLLPSCSITELALALHDLQQPGLCYGWH